MNNVTSFKEYFIHQENEINEIFNNPIPVRWVTTTSNNWKGQFLISNEKENKKYIINIIKLEKNMPWEITFDLIKDKSKTQEITGTGDSFQVFSTVLNAIKQWMNATKPNAFLMTAREPSRQSLYRRMLQMLPRKIWKVEDLGSTFYVQNKTMKQLAYSGFSDSDFDDYMDD